MKFTSPMRLGNQDSPWWWFCRNCSLRPMVPGRLFGGAAFFPEAFKDVAAAKMGGCVVFKSGNSVLRERGPRKIVLLLVAQRRFRSSQVGFCFVDSGSVIHVFPPSSDSDDAAAALTSFLGSSSEL